MLILSEPLGKAFGKEGKEPLFIKEDRQNCPRKKTRILSGLIPLSDVKEEITSLISTHFKDRRRIAPSRVIIQYVDRLTFPNFKDGKKRTERRKKRIVMPTIVKLKTIRKKC